MVFNRCGFKLFNPLVLLAILILSTTHVFAQDAGGIIKGVLVYGFRKPVSCADVILLKSGKSVKTEQDGSFVLNAIPAGIDTLVVLSSGTALYKHVIIIKNGDLRNLGIITVLNHITQLQQVEIAGRKLHSYKSDYSFFGSKTQTPLADIPQSISTVTSDLIKDKMELTLKDAMNDVAGVNQYSGYDEYTIRGFRAENARDINGLRGYNTTYTSAMLVNIDRVEVIKGPAATLYGNCDPGGTINLVTKKPLDTAQAVLDIYYGSWNQYRTALDLTGPLNKSKTLLYRFNAEYDDGDSFRNHIHSRSYEFAPSISYIPNDKLHFNIDFSIANTNTVLDRGQPGIQGDNNLNGTPISLTLNQPGDYLHETDIATTATVSYKISDNLSFNAGYLNYQTQQNVAGHGLQSYITKDSVNLYYSKWTYPTTTNTFSGYFTYQLNGGQARNLLLAGYDYVRSTDNLNQQYFELPIQFGEGSGIVGTLSLKNIQYVVRPVGAYKLSYYDSDATNVNDDVYHTHGVYVQDQFSFDKWKVLLSLREEFYKGDEAESVGDALTESIFLPRLGIVYVLKSNINVYATYNNGFDPFEAATSAQVFNAPFKPIKSNLLEVGAKGSFFNHNLFASLATYQLTVQNVAVNANDISNPNLFVQQGENRSRGIEAEVSGNILPNLNVMLSYAWCDAVVTKSDIASQIGSKVENSPHNSSASWIKYTFSQIWLKGFGLAVGHSQVGERATLQPGVTLPGYFIINTGVHYGYKHILLNLNVNNITNQTYWQGAYNNVNKWPGAPRNYMLSLEYRF